MLITTNGIVIREKQVGENDKFIDILTADFGVIEISVKGSKKITSKNSSATQLYAYSKFCIQKNGERAFLNSSEPIHIFYNIRLDVDKFSLASYFSEILLYSIPSEEISNDILRLFLNSLHFLSEKNSDIYFIKSIFELRLVSEIGMMPDIVACKNCAVYSTEKMFFLINDGIILCNSCYKSGENSNNRELSPSLLHTIRYIVLTDFDRLWKFKVTDEVQKRLSYITENYLLSQLGRNFKTLDFFKSIVSNQP
ncbi:MAG: DNA repair protein RecO [Oscillospiraceae bacterium]